MPGDSGVGPLFLRDLCRICPNDRLSMAVVGKRSRDNDASMFPAVPKVWLQRQERLERGDHHRWISALKRHSVFIGRNWQNDAKNAHELVQFARAQRVEQVWAVLDAPSIYRIAPRVAARLNVPLHVTVWDPPEGVGLLYGLDRLSRRTARADFAAALRASTRCSVISERMDRDYRETFATDNVVLRHGIAPAEQLPPRFARQKEELSIGFCGSLYAESEWSAFLRALDELRWMIDERPIRLVVAGSRVPRIVARSPAHVEFLGWRNVEEVVCRLAECDFTYLPYWFNPAYAESVRLCFPTKLTTYLTAGRPVFYHGPSDAAVVDFFRRFPVARCCHTLDVGSIASTVADFARATDERQRMQLEVHRAVREELNLHVFHARFREFIGIPDVPTQSIETPAPLELVKQ